MVQLRNTKHTTRVFIIKISPVKLRSNYLILLRHGQSLWNREKRFTGWTNASLSEKGITEAQRAVAILKKKNLTFDVCYTSLLSRATETVKTVLHAMGQESIPIHASWRLNERHYGALQGLTWWEASNRYGAKQVLIWQRHFRAKPPELTKDDPRFPGNDSRYSDIDPQDLPFSESLEDTQNRLIPYWRTDIFPSLLQNKNILIIAHQNSLRSLLKYLSDINDQDIKKVTVKTAEPVICTFDEEGNFVDYSYLRWKPKIQDYTHRLLHTFLP
jgi:2,3-bisphosphoglycerate-dependent phosphoglycerate mutase